MKKMMLLAALAVAFASCQSNGKKSEEQEVETKAVIVEAGMHEPDSVGYIVRVGDIAPEMEMELLYLSWTKGMATIWTGSFAMCLNEIQSLLTNILS